MTWTFTPDRPIYLQLQEHLKLSIVSGRYPPGDKLPAVRDLALEAAVNPNTMQRALTELERDGLVFTQRTSGRYVTEDGEVIKKVKNDLAMELVDAFLVNMAAIGYGADETTDLIKGRRNGSAGATARPEGKRYASDETAALIESGSESEWKEEEENKNRKEEGGAYGDS